MGRYGAGSWAGFDHKTCGGLSLEAVGAQRGNTRQSNRMSDNTQEVVWRRLLCVRKSMPAVEDKGAF